MIPPQARAQRTLEKPPIRSQQFPQNAVSLDALNPKTTADDQFSA
jgi:hypothetical protein